MIRKSTAPPRELRWRRSRADRNPGRRPRWRLGTASALRVNGHQESCRSGRLTTDQATKARNISVQPALNGRQVR